MTQGAAKTFLSIGEAMIEMSPADGGNWALGYAGDTLNTAWHARQRLGPDWNVDYFTALGADRYSADLRSFIADAGIGTERIVTVPNRKAGLYFIHQQDGDRQFTYWRDRSAAKLLARDTKLLEAAMQNADCIYFSGITLAILEPEDRASFLSAIAHQDTTVCFDPNIREALWSGREEIREWLMHAARLSTIILPSFEDEQRIFGDPDPHATAARYAAAGVCEVVVKDGGRPALFRNGDEVTEIAAPTLERVVDATGAGDSFNAGYLCARLSGDHPVVATGKAHATAARCLAHQGALPVTNLSK